MPCSLAVCKGWGRGLLGGLAALAARLLTHHVHQVYGVYDEKCPTASGFGKAGQHIPYIILEHCPCTDLFSFLVFLLWRSPSFCGRALQPQQRASACGSSARPQMRYLLSFASAVMKP